MFVGEAPGRDEDLAGLPFVGRSGQLLDRMIGAIGLDRTKVYIANIIPWRPPGNRTPTPQETQICLPFIRRQIELVNPDVLVCLGNPSTPGILDTKEGIMRTRGRWRDYDTGTRTIKAMPTFHPAYLSALADLQEARVAGSAGDQGGVGVVFGAGRNCTSLLLCTKNDTYCLKTFREKTSRRLLCVAIRARAGSRLAVGP